MLQNSPLMIVETSMVMMRVRHRDGDFAFNQSVCLKNLCESIEVAAGCADPIRACLRGLARGTTRRDDHPQQKTSRTRLRRLRRYLCLAAGFDSALARCRSATCAEHRVYGTAGIEHQQVSRREVTAISERFLTEERLWKSLVGHRCFHERTHELNRYRPVGQAETDDRSRFLVVRTVGVEPTWLLTAGT